MKTTYFFNMIQTLRQSEAVILYLNNLTVTAIEEKETARFLEEEYNAEALDYPFQAPLFNTEAALWAARTVYLAAQFILYRKNGEEELDKWFVDCPEKVTPSTMLSADLCLRFVPDMLRELRLIDPEDELIKKLENQLQIWHYSAINYRLDTIDELNFEPILANNCLKQLYCNRIVTTENLRLAERPELNALIASNLGPFAQDLWLNFKPIT